MGEDFRKKKINSDLHLFLAPLPSILILDYIHYFTFLRYFGVLYTIPNRFRKIKDTKKNKSKDFTRHIP